MHICIYNINKINNNIINIINIINIHNNIKQGGQRTTPRRPEKGAVEERVNSEGSRRSSRAAEAVFSPGFVFLSGGVVCFFCRRRQHPRQQSEVCQTFSPPPQHYTRWSAARLEKRDAKRAVDEDNAATEGDRNERLAV